MGWVWSDDDDSDGSQLNTSSSRDNISERCQKDREIAVQNGGGGTWKVRQEMRENRRASPKLHRKVIILILSFLIYLFIFMTT